MSAPEEPPGPPPGSLPAVPARLPPEVLAEIRGALVEARVAAEQRAAYGPLRDLAEALKGNAEALRAVQETQERIARSVDRADRSEAVLQSTQALNETFRGVRASQDALVDRLKKEERRPLRAALAAALLVAGTLGLAAWAYLGREDGLRERIEGLRSGMASADLKTWEESRRAAEKDLLDRLEALSKASSLSEAERGAREKDLLALRDELDALQRQGDSLAARRGEMEAEVGRLRDENASLRTSLEAQRKASEETLRTLREREAEAAALRASAAAAPAPLPLPPPPVSPPAPAASSPAPPALGPQAVTDRGQVAKVVDDLNALLGLAEGTERYRVLAARAVDGDRLAGVTLESRGADGTVRRSFVAEEARFVLVAASRSLEIRLRGGSVTYLGHRTVKFLDDRHTAFLQVDPAVFRASGNPVLAVQ